MWITAASHVPAKWARENGGKGRKQGRQDEGDWMPLIARRNREKNAVISKLSWTLHVAVACDSRQSSRPRGSRKEKEKKSGKRKKGKRRKRKRGKREERRKKIKIFLAKNRN